MENSVQYDTEDVCADGHARNDAACVISRQCNPEDIGEVNLCTSIESVNTISEDYENSQQSGGDLPKCEGLPVLDDGQLGSEVNCCDSHEQTAVGDKSVSPDSPESVPEVACVALEVPPVVDSANLELEATDNEGSEGSGGVLLLNAGVSCSNGSNKEINCDVFIQNTPLVQTLEKRNGEDDTLLETKVECVSQGSECYHQSEPILLDCSELSDEQNSSKENRESCSEEVIPSFKGDLQSKGPEYSESLNASSIMRTCDDDIIEDSAASASVEVDCSDKTAESHPCSVNHLGCVGDEILHCKDCSHCKDLIVRNCAASVIDEILRLATKHVVKAKFKNRNVTQGKEDIVSEKSKLQTSDHKERSMKTVRQRPTLETAVVQYVPFDIGNSLLRQSSGMGYSLSKSVPDLSLCNELIVQTDDQKFQNYFEAISERFVSPVCNGSIVLSNQSDDLSCNSKCKLDQPMSSVSSLSECDKNTNAQNLMEGKRLVSMLEGECPQSCVEEIGSEREDSNKHDSSSLSLLDKPRIEKISGEENVAGGLMITDIKTDDECKSEEHNDDSNMDEKREDAVQRPPADSAMSEFCSSTPEPRNHISDELCDTDVTLSPDENVSNIITEQELNAEAKELKDCLKHCEMENSHVLDTYTQCGLNELEVSTENQCCKDTKVCEDLVTLFFSKDDNIPTSRNLLESHGEETNSNCNVTSSDSCHDNVSDEPELVVANSESNVDLTDEDLSCILEKPEQERSGSPTIAQYSPNELSPFKFEEKCENSNNPADIQITVSPAQDAGDHGDLLAENQGMASREVSALGDVLVRSPEMEGDDAELSTLQQGQNAGSQIDNVNCLINKSRRSVLPSDSLHPHEVCTPILEEDCEGLSIEDSELSPAASDSESDMIMKISKSSHDGTNSISYLPLLEEDLNSRSTLSLISEFDESCGKETNLIEDNVDDDSSALLKTDDDVDKLEHSESERQSVSPELTQRIKGRRIKHDKEASHDQGMVVEGVPHAEYAGKINEIKNVLKSGSKRERLQELACSRGGLVTDEIRRDVWPLLLGIDMTSARRSLPPVKAEELRSHPEYNQVVLDVNRSLRRFPSKISSEERLRLQEQLTEIILRVLIKRRNLYYYQGYHDVAVTTLLVAGRDSAFHILERISTAHLSECMLPTMERTMYLLNYIYPLLQRISPHLAERLDRLEVGTIFCLPWFLTWYGYSLNRYEDVVRVFDYFLASPPLAPLYLAAVVVSRRSAEVLTADCDQATVHALLSKIPDSLPLEDLLAEASELYHAYPPSVIETEVQERCERLRKAQEEEEEQRRRRRQRRVVQRRHSMPAMAPRQLPGWVFIQHFLRFTPGSRFARLSATIMFGVIAWNWRNEMFRYF